MRFFWILFFGCFITQVSNAQLNIRSGYIYSYSKPEIYNALIDKLNADNSTLTDYESMKRLKSFHGLLLGARYRLEPAALSLDFSFKFQTRDYEGTNPTSEESEYRTDYLAIRSLSPGVEFFVERFSFGGTLDLNSLRIRSENYVTTTRHIIYRKTALSSHFFVGYNLYGSEAVSLALQPFIQIPWTKFNLSSIDEEYETDANLDDYDEGLFNIGLRVLITNGYYER